MRSKDQLNHSKIKSQTQRTPTQNFIRQTGSKVEVGTCSDAREETVAINCETLKSARHLALELSGTKLFTSNARQIEFVKLHTHPWYGTVLLEELTREDKNFIGFYIRKYPNISNHDFKLNVHGLFIDDPYRPVNHALIQELLLIIAMSGKSNE